MTQYQTPTPELFDYTPRQIEIITCSAKLFQKKGYLATSIRDISETLSMTSAALYYHFKNKEEILLAIMKIALKNLYNDVSQAIEKEDPADVWGQVRAAVRTHLSNSLANQDFSFVVLTDLRHLSTEAREEVVRMRDEYEQIWDGVLAKGQAQGLFKKDVDLDLMTLLTFGAINLAISWYKPSGTYSPDEIADSFLALIGRGVLAD